MESAESVMGAIEHRNLVAQAAKIGGAKAEQILVVFSHTHGAGLMGLDRASLPGGEEAEAAVSVARRR